GGAAAFGRHLAGAAPVGNRSCQRHPWPRGCPLQRAAATCGEIVNPCILDPDGEDEGGQASSSVAVSTRWISTAKLLQSDLATLAQREGGE
ncbi:hypothetical protein B296_00055829, partial [Ensete ventricosum]